MTYVDPTLGVRERRSQLVAWGFGQCDCERCVEEKGGKRRAAEARVRMRQKSNRIWTTWRERARQDWASCDYYLRAVFSESFHTDYHEWPLVMIDTNEILPHNRGGGQ